MICILVKNGHMIVEDNKCEVKFFSDLDDDLAKKIEDAAYKFTEDYLTINEAIGEA